MTKLKQWPLYIKILLGMAAGVVFGYIFLLTGLSGFVTDWVKPLGTIFIKLLKLIAVPLVFVSLIKGVTGMKDLKQLSGLGLKTLAVYMATTLFAVLLGVGMVNLVRPGDMFPQEKAEVYKQQYQSHVEAGIGRANAMTETGPMDFIVEIVPENIMASASSNSNMLQVIFVALLAGVAMVALGSKQIAPVLTLIDALDRIILKVVDFVMMFAPVGVFALLAGLIVDFSGDAEMFKALGVYALTVVVALFVLMFLFYPSLLKIFTRFNLKRYFQGVFPIQLVAFSISSSSATLPFTMEQVQKKLGVSEEVASFVLPVGATINMDGTSCYQAISILFIAQIFGIDLTLAQMLAVVFLTVLASIGTPGVPGASVVMTVMVMTSVGIPVEGLALILGIDRPLDMLRTVVNVTGDSFVAVLMEERASKGKKPNLSKADS